jgi:hypothetical protein
MAVQVRVAAGEALEQAEAVVQIIHVVDLS